MSFILDALKKSETERQRQTIPGLVDSGAGRRGTRLPVWAVALSALLAVNLIVLLVVLARGWLAGPVPPGARKTDAAVAARAAPAAGAQQSDHFSPLDAAPQYAPEIPVGGDAAPAAPPPRRTATPSRESAAPVPYIADAAAPQGHRRDPVLTSDENQAGAEEALPSINEISLTGAQALPDLHLDVHVYATKASERFVYINMRKYHEGSTLQEGPVLERIRRDGAVLNYQGLRFLLPRQ